MSGKSVKSVYADSMEGYQDLSNFDRSLIVGRGYTGHASPR